MMVYVGLRYQDLIRRGEVLATDYLSLLPSFFYLFFSPAFVEHV